MEFGFFLKKFISFFLEPFGIVVTLFVLGIYFLYMKKEKKAKLLFLGSLFSLLLFSYPPFTNLLVMPLENQYTKFEYKDCNNSKNIEYIHVLGNGHTTDRTQPISSQLSDGGTKRVLEGVIIQKYIPNSQLILTGYQGKTNTSNAVMNARLASALGVDAKQMIINGAPVDTREEALFTKTIVGEKPFILVTSATHMPRAMLLFESLGMHPIAAPTNFHKEEFLGYARTPKAIYFHISTVAVHEYIGILWSMIQG
jgi:uncharacterized SAM-binding protein YcdF (DUF218 family)